MKKILVNYIGKSGSGPMNAYEIAKGLIANNCEVYAIVSKYVDNRNDWENLKGIKEVYYINTNKKSGISYYIAAQIRFMLIDKWRVKSHFSGISFDYVVTAMQHLWSIDISKILNKRKIVWLCHDPIPHSGSGKIDTYLGNTFAKISDEIIVMSKKFIPLVSRRWNIPLKKIHYMPLGRHDTYTKFEVTKKLYEDGRYNFVFFGYLREYKGLHILAKAFEKLSQERDDVTLTVAGSGDFSAYENDFKNLRNVQIFNEYISDSEVSNYFSGPNIITVIPYLDGTQSGISLIAMEYSSPIIASDTGGLKEQLDDGNIGFFSKPGDVDSLYRQMKYVIDNPELVKEQKIKMNDYLKKLEWNNVVKVIADELG